MKRRAIPAFGGARKVACGAFKTFFLPFRSARNAALQRRESIGEADPRHAARESFSANSAMIDSRSQRLAASASKRRLQCSDTEKSRSGNTGSTSA